MWRHQWFRVPQHGGISTTTQRGARVNGVAENTVHEHPKAHLRLRAVWDMGIYVINVAIHVGDTPQLLPCSAPEDATADVCFKRRLLAKPVYKSGMVCNRRI
ncbi:hypothetical protein MTO96_050672 [Rhipicephalus appendiculatus]